MEKKVGTEKFQVQNIKWKKWKKKNLFDIPWYGLIKVDIQTLSDEALEKIIEKENLLNTNIPKKKEVITIENQSDYYQKVKKEVLNRIFTTKFAIIQWPTWTWKTTLVKTIWYEMQVPVYEVGADSEKTIDDFAKEIKTIKKGNILQVKAFPWILIKAITQWGIFLINEANTLPFDIQIALANMLESGFVVVGTKKYLVHHNFSLIFTSNEDYAWTNSYNKAVIRKAWWIVNFDYEPTLEWEIKIVKTLYKKLQQEFNFENKLSEEYLGKIAKNVRKLRNTLREYNSQVDLEKKILSQDLNDAWHFLYIRFYEKLLKEILTSDYPDLKKLVEDIFLSYLQDVLVGFSQTWDIINHRNNVDKVKEIIYKNIEDVIIRLEREEKGDKLQIDVDLLKEFEERCGDESEFIKEAKKIIDFSWLEDEKKIQEQRKKVWFTKKWINVNLFKKIVENQVKTVWERLRRIEKINELAEDMYQKLVDSRREKTIWEIKYANWKLEVEINGEKIIFQVKDWEKFDLSKIKTKEDVLNEVFGNNKLEIVYEDEVFDNIFSHPKSLEIRRYSKMIDYGNKIVFLWFRWEIRDIRYIWEETKTFYIPQAKANDLLVSIYEVISKDDLKDKWHYLVLNSYNELEFLNVDDIKKRDDVRILKKIKDELLEKQIRQRFANIDKLNIHNGIEETKETWNPTPVYGSAYAVQRMIEKQLWKNFEVISPTTAKQLDKIIQALELNEDVLLIWPSGVGKSSFAKESARRLRLPYIDLQITDNLEENDLSSKLEWNEWEIEQVFSPFLDYWVNGGVVELKELNMASVLTFLNNFLDKNGTISINWQEYRRNPDFHIIATINPFDQRIYSWTKPLNLAVQARFKVINLSYLEKDEEKGVLLEIVKMFNKKLLDEWVDEVLEEILNFYVYPIRNKIEELRKTSDFGTDEVLQVLSEKNVTIDILWRWLKTANNIWELREMLIDHLKLSDEKKQIIPDDIRFIFQ